MSKIYPAKANDIDYVITPEGKVLGIAPCNGEWYTLEELQAMVDGYIQSVVMTKIVFVFNEEGRPRNLPLNRGASMMLRTPVFGDVVVISNKSRWK